jgi:beta-hydroxylase
MPAPMTMMRLGKPSLQQLRLPAAWAKPSAMAHMAETTGSRWMKRLKKRRRKSIKRQGTRLIRGLANFLGRQSTVGDAPVLDSRHFPFLKSFTDNWQAILAEVTEILKHREAIPVFQDVSPDQKRISKGNNWRTFILFGFGEKLEKNSQKAPVTTRLLESVPHLQSAWFSILGPGYHIPAHAGVTRGILRAHLGLIVPKEAEKCRMRVGGTINVWRPGEIFVFDDTYEHEVWNDTDEERVILLFDFDRPMRFWGRVLNKTFIRLLKLTAYYQEPKKNMMTFEDRFEAATRRANENLEKLADAD